MRARARVAHRCAGIALALCALLSATTRAQTPPAPPAPPAVQPSSPVPPSPPPPQSAGAPARAHPHLSFDVRLINTDVSENFFASTLDLGGGGAQNALVCRHGCADSASVTFEFCYERVTYSFCKRGDASALSSTASDQDAVDVTERAVRAQYLMLTRALAARSFEPSAGCRATLRKWFCYEFFNRCSVDGSKYMPTCKSVCLAVKKDCGEANSAFIDCDVEREEFDLGGNTPATYYTGGYYENETYINTPEGKASGTYIKGTKPNGENGTLVFEESPGKCTGAASLSSLRLAVAFIFLVALASWFD